jgi:aminopeptidase N
MHMLRYLFGGTSAGSDQLLQEILREFLETFRGKLAGTEELKRIFEKRLPKSLDLEGNGRLDWFFDEWIYSTGIPEYRIQYTFTPQPRGGGVLKGKILQSKVPEEFMMPVEVFVQYGPEKLIKEKIGRVVTTGSETPFRFQLKRKPLKVTLDDNQWILCDNKTQ